MRTSYWWRAMRFEDVLGWCRTQASPASRFFLAILLGTGFTSCAGGIPRGPIRPTLPQAPTSVPGFDTRNYPGDAAMQTWRANSPYQWVGYYLPAPCFTNRSWVGKRSTLHSQRWGTAVLFVGEQDWRAMGRADSAGVAVEGSRCTVANLTSENGRSHAQVADSAAFAEGFTPGTIVFLDVERVDSVSAALTGYVRAWFNELLAQGKYRPGLYAHERNATVLLAAASAEYASASRTDQPILWVAKSGGFTLESRPAASGVSSAGIWQGAHNLRETWGGVTLTIDANVATPTAAEALRRR